MNCACQVQSTNSEMTPTSSAARPSHSMNTPGASTSSTSSTAPAMNQSQTPSEASSVSIEAPQLIGLELIGLELIGLAPAAGTAGTVGRGRGALPPAPSGGPPNVALATPAMPASEPSMVVGS